MASSSRGQPPATPSAFQRVKTSGLLPSRSASLPTPVLPSPPSVAAGAAAGVRPVYVAAAAPSTSPSSPSSSSSAAAAATAAAAAAAAAAAGVMVPPSAAKYSEHHHRKQQGARFAQQLEQLRMLQQLHASLSTSVQQRRAVALPAFHLPPPVATMSTTSAAAAAAAAAAAVAAAAAAASSAAPSARARHLCSASPFVCRRCFVALPSAAELVRHELVHMPQGRLYRCRWRGCGRAFADASNAKRHEKSHVGATPFHCLVDGCGRKFTRRSSLRVHLSSVHALAQTDALFVEALKRRATPEGQGSPSMLDTSLPLQRDSP